MYQANLPPACAMDLHISYIFFRSKGLFCNRADNFLIMGFNKMAAYRYRLIDFCLQNRQRRWTIQSLREYLSVKMSEEFDRAAGLSERQLLYDIALMRKDPPQGYGAPIVRKGGFIFYSDPDFSISNAPFNEMDLQTLRTALHLLRPFDELPYFEELHTLLLKLEGRGEGPGMKNNRPIILFEKNELLKGKHWLAKIFEHILQKKALRIVYHPFYLNEPIEVIFHPHLLKEFNSRWFALGWNEREQAVWNLALDRIQDIDSLELHPYFANLVLDPDQYFKDIIGVTIPEKMEKVPVRLLFTAARAPYVLTKPLHWSQKVLENYADGSLEIEISVIPNRELESMLLSFGADCEVLSPGSLRQEIARLTLEAANKYNR